MSENMCCIALRKAPRSAQNQPHTSEATDEVNPPSQANGQHARAAARAQGVQLGRRKGSKNKKGRALDAHQGQIKRLLELEVRVGSITKIVNAEIERPVMYNTYRYYIAHDEEMKPLLANRKAT